MSQTIRHRVRPDVSVQPVAKSRKAGSVTATVRLPFGEAEANATDACDADVRALKDYTDSKAIADPFRAYYNQTFAGALQIMEPPYSPYSLMRLPYENSMLGQCIEAMITNTHGHGYGLEYIGPEGQEESAEAKAEEARLKGLIDYPNDDMTMMDLLARAAADSETLGNMFLEIGRDKKGEIVMVSHLPAHTMRMTVRDPESIQVKVTLPRASGPVEQTVNKRFRRFVQIVNNKRVWFKEFGDPRTINPNNGVPQEGLALEDSATEVIHVGSYHPGNAYGLPRWFNQLPAVLGSRQAELTNLDFFNENAIPAMALLVAGGMLTEGSVESIESHFTAARGRQSMNRVLVLEASGDDLNASTTGAVPVPKIELRPLQNERQGDALFQVYEKNCQDKIRSAFRLPPLFVGMSQDMTYATAKTSYEVAETQVFKPARERFDSMFNLKVLSTLKPKFWRFRSNPPRLSDNEELMAAVEGFDKVGGMTPNVAIALAKKTFGIEIEPVKEAWGDFPYLLVQQALQQGKLRMDLQNEEPPPPVAPVAPGDNGAAGDKGAAGGKNAPPGKKAPAGKDKPAATGKKTKEDYRVDATLALLAFRDALSSFSAAA